MSSEPKVVTQKEFYDRVHELIGLHFVEKAQLNPMVAQWDIDHAIAWTTNNLHAIDIINSGSAQETIVALFFDGVSIIDRKAKAMEYFGAPYMEYCAGDSRALKNVEFAINNLWNAYLPTVTKGEHHA